MKAFALIALVNAVKVADDSTLVQPYMTPVDDSKNA